MTSGKESKGHPPHMNCPNCPPPYTSGGCGQNLSHVFFSSPRHVRYFGGGISFWGGYIFFLRGPLPSGDCTFLNTLSAVSCSSHQDIPTWELFFLDPFFWVPGNPQVLKKAWFELLYSNIFDFYYSNPLTIQIILLFIIRCSRRFCFFWLGMMAWLNSGHAKKPKIERAALKV